LDNLPPFRTFATPPSISVLTPTYGRTRRLPGLLESFLQQEYVGAHELIILNDRADQHLVLDPAVIGTKDISIINETTHRSTLGDKRNALASLAGGDFVCWWDDDDRYLPTHLTRALSLVRTGYRGAQPSHIWLDEGTTAPSLQRPWSPFANAIMERSAIFDAGGFPLQQMHQDVALANAMHLKLHAFWAESDTGFPTCIYRKPGTSDHTHVGQFTDTTNSVAARAYMQGAVDESVREGAEPTGTVVLTPRWERDYTSWCNAAWKASRNA
jgi:Glycosyl transferase family 2